MTPLHAESSQDCKRSTENYPLVSVIVPVYNVSGYIRKCVDSILHQTYTHLEIILVDDGSTDGSAEILDEYEKTDSRVRVIRQINQGVSVARNAALDCMQGKYTVFVDGDDFIDSDLVMTTCELMEEKCLDCVSFEYTEVDEDDAPIRNMGHAFDTFTEVSADEALTIALSAQVMWNPWVTVFNSRCWDQVRFPPGIVMAEDAMTTYLAYANMANPGAFIQDRLYYYRRRKSSATQSLRRTQLYAYQTFAAHRERYRYACSHCSTEAVLRCMEIGVLSAIDVMVYAAYDGDEYAEAVEFLNEMPEDYLPKLSIKHRIKYLMARKCPKLMKHVLKRYYSVCK